MNKLAPVADKGVKTVRLGKESKLVNPPLSGSKMKTYRQIQTHFNKGKPVMFVEKPIVNAIKLP